MRTPLTREQLDAAQASLPGWHCTPASLERTFRFGTFREAIGFIVRLAFEAEALDHHPELTNVYNQVTIRLHTHDAGGQVTGMDVRLARAIDALAPAP